MRVALFVTELELDKPERCGTGVVVDSEGITNGCPPPAFSVGGRRNREQEARFDLHGSHNRWKIIMLTRQVMESLEAKLIWISIGIYLTAYIVLVSLSELTPFTLVARDDESISGYYASRSSGRGGGSYSTMNGMGIACSSSMFGERGPCTLPTIKTTQISVWTSRYSSWFGSYSIVVRVVDGNGQELFAQADSWVEQEWRSRSLYQALVPALYPVLVYLVAFALLRMKVFKRSTKGQTE